MEKEIAILMADLTGYTAMTDVHGGASAAKIVGTYMKIVDAALHGDTKVMQRIGDQVVMISEDVYDLLETARRLNTLTWREHHFLSIHAGMHFGRILIENDNLFGSAINVTSRITNLASRGQILCSSNFIDHLPVNAKSSFRSFGIHALKNVMSKIELFELLHTPENEVHIDPVCHMHVDPAKQNPSTEYQGNIFYFCSEHCKGLFTASPELFVGSVQNL